MKAMPKFYIKKNEQKKNMKINCIFNRINDKTIE